MVVPNLNRSRSNVGRIVFLYLILSLVLVLFVVVQRHEKAFVDTNIDDKAVVEERSRQSSQFSTETPVECTEKGDESDTKITSISTERSFLEIGLKTGTDKVQGENWLPGCLKDPNNCVRDAFQPKCRTGQNHFYHTLYQKWLGPSYSTDDATPFQFLEIGFFKGSGFEAYSTFLPNGEGHSIEISCIEQGPRSEGKWPWGNFASENHRYQELLDTDRLHCGDASQYKFLSKVWTEKLKRPDAPPLRLVIDDGSHLSNHMAISLFFWFPRIEPHGILVVEDVQPIRDANDFRVHVLTQVMKDLHYCGDDVIPDDLCFPTISRLMQSVHCEMHICVFERNGEPAEEPDEEKSMPPKHALDARKCLFRE